MQTAEALVALNNGLAANPASIKLAELLPIGGALTDGFSGKIKSIGYIATGLVLTNDQKIVVNGVEHVIPAGQKAVSLAITYEDGATTSLSVLRRSAKSSINGAGARSFDFGDFNGFVGKTLTVNSVAMDPSTERMNSSTDANGVVTQRPNVGKTYKVTIA